MKFFVLLGIFCLIAVDPILCRRNRPVRDQTALPEVVGDKFLYFGFGSNLLAKRIHIQNKSAVRKGIGKLKDYQLDFYGNSTKWNGAVATIIPSPDRAVWGAIWEIDLNKMDDLDRQEGVRNKKYYPLSVPVTTRTGDIIICRTYRLTKELTPVLPHQERPYDRQPSLTYLKTIVKGANESHLPRGYINYLERFRHNGNTVQDLEEELDLTDFVIGAKKDSDTEKKETDTDKKETDTDKKDSGTDKKDSDTETKDSDTEKKDSVILLNLFHDLYECLC